MTTDTGIVNGPAGRSGEPLGVAILDHVDWIRAIARMAARRHGVDGPQERDDITSAGVVELCRIAPRFVRPEWAETPENLIDAVRGWANLWIRKACDRECERLKNGGTYHARRQVAGQSLIIAKPFSDLVTPKTGEEVDPVCNRDMDSRPSYTRFISEALSNYATRKTRGAAR